MKNNHNPSYSNINIPFQIFYINIKNLRKILTLVILIIFANFISTKFESSNNLNLKNFKNSIYFSDIDPLSSLDFDQEIERPHKIDLMILKLENEQESQSQPDEETIESKTYLNLKLSKNFYDVNFCIDEIDSPNKNYLTKKLNKITKNKQKLTDDSYTELIQNFKKFDFAEIEPKDYNIKKNKENYSKTSNDESFSDENDLNTEFEKCYKKFEYLNNDSPRFNFAKSENFNFIKIINQTNVKHENEIEHFHFLDDFTDIKFGDSLLKIKNYVNNIIKWVDEKILLELNFKYEKKNKRFLLSNIFVIFFKMFQLELSEVDINLINSYNGKNLNLNSANNNIIKDNYLSLIQNNQIFDNIFIDYKFLNKQIKFSKNYLNSNKNKISIKNFFKNNTIIKSFSTLQSESIFHNKIKLIIDIKKYKDLILKTNMNNLICFIFYHHITEDNYIEKNEFRGYLDKFYPEYEKNYFFSDDIDQEISSDISKQYFVSFSLCNKKDFFKNINNEIEIVYPIHFRYQPPLRYISHQETFLTLPLVDLIIQESQTFIIEKIILENYFSINIDYKNYYVKSNSKRNKNVLYDERKIFKDEITQKLNIINNYKLFLNNINLIRHFIPVGQLNHFIIVLIGTFTVTLLGFFIILYGIFNSKIKEKVNKIE